MKMLIVVLLSLSHGVVDFSQVHPYRETTGGFVADGGPLKWIRPGVYDFRPLIRLSLEKDSLLARVSEEGSVKYEEEYNRIQKEFLRWKAYYLSGIVQTFVDGGVIILDTTPVLVVNLPKHDLRVGDYLKTFAFPVSLHDHLGTKIAKYDFGSPVNSPTVPLLDLP